MCFVVYVRYDVLCSAFLIDDLILDSSLFCYDKLTHTTLHYRCDLGSCGRNVASCCLPNPSRHCHGDCVSWRHPDEDVEDVDPATHHLQFNHRCSVSVHSHQIILYCKNIAYFRHYLAIPFTAVILLLKTQGKALIYSNPDSEIIIGMSCTRHMIKYHYIIHLFALHPAVMACCIKWTFQYPISIQVQVITG